MIYAHRQPLEIRGMEVRYWSPIPGYPSPSHFLDGNHPPRAYDDILLNGDEVHDASEMKRAREGVSALNESKDTLRGVHFQFGEKAKYASLVEALDICYSSHPYYFTASSNSIWIFNFIRPEADMTEGRPFVCGTDIPPPHGKIVQDHGYARTLSDDDVEWVCGNSKPTWSEIQRRQLMQGILVAMVMIIIAWLTGRNRKRKKKYANR